MGQHNKYGKDLQLFRYTGSTPPTEKSHGWRVNVAGNVAALTFQEAVLKIEKQHGDIEIYSMNHAGQLTT